MTVVIQPNDIVKGSVLRATSNNILTTFFRVATLKLHCKEEFTRTALIPNPGQAKYGKRGGVEGGISP